MFRGDVWDTHLPPRLGIRPCPILTRNPLIGLLGAITVAEITGIAGPSTTHVELGADAGLTGRAQSWVNTTGLHTISRAKLQRHRGRLTPTELTHVSEAIRAVLDLD